MDGVLTVVYEILSVIIISLFSECQRVAIKHASLE